MNVEFHFFSNNGREWKMSATRTISGHLRIHSTIANTMLKAWETGKWGKKPKQKKKTHTKHIIQRFKDESFKDDGSKKSHIVIVQLNSGSIYNLHNFHAHTINESLCPVDHL